MLIVLFNAYALLFLDCLVVYMAFSESFMFFGCFSFLKMDYTSIYPWAKKDLIKEKSVYTTHLKIRELRESGGSSTYEKLVKVVLCGEDELVCCDESSNPNGPLCFFYDTFITKLRLSLPLTVFLKGDPDQAIRGPCPAASKQLGIHASFQQALLLIWHFANLEHILLPFILLEEGGVESMEEEGDF